MIQEDTWDRHLPITIPICYSTTLDPDPFNLLSFPPPLLLSFHPCESIILPSFPPDYIPNKAPVTFIFLHSHVSILALPLPLSALLLLSKGQIKTVKASSETGGSGSIPSSLLLCSSLMAKDERVIFRVSWGSLVRHTRMAASDTHECTSYLSSVIVCKAGPHN